MALAEHAREELTVGLYDAGAIKFSDFTWTLKVGRKSPVYYNQRPLTSLGSREKRGARLRLRNLIVDGVSDGINEVTQKSGLTHDHLFGLPQSATLLTGLVAGARDESAFWGRVGEKDYGAHSKIEGDFGQGDVVVAIDDVITNGDSKLEALTDLAKVGLRVGGFVVTMDRQEGGRQAIEAEGFEMASVLTMAESVKMLRDNNRIGSQELEWMHQYGDNLREAGVVDDYLRGI